MNEQQTILTAFIVFVLAIIFSPAKNGSGGLKETKKADAKKKQDKSASIKIYK